MFVPFLEVLDPIISIGANVGCVVLAAYTVALTGATAGGAA